MMSLYPSNTLNNDTIITDLPRGNGSEGAKAYPTQPNTRDVVWDNDENYFWIRVTNSANRITSLERYSYTASPEPTMEDLFATKDDFNSLKGELSDVRQSLQDILSAITEPSAAVFNGSAKSDGRNSAIGKSARSKTKSDESIDCE